MALTFDTRKAVQKLLQRGLPEPAADGIVEVVEEATSPVITADRLHVELNRVSAELRAEFFRVSLIQGGIIIGAVVALVKLL